MHPNPAFRATDSITALSFASDVGFGTLAVNGQDGPMLSHVPFIIDGNSVRLHLVRSNPIARATKEPMKAKIAVSGPHSYVSPDWYELEDQVPTWNYVAVHLIGDLIPAPPESLGETLDLLSEEFETRLLPKPAWTSDKMDRSALEKMMRMVQPFRLEISDIQSTYKLNQNKAASARLAAAENIQSDGIGSEVRALSSLMKSIQSED